MRYVLESKFICYSMTESQQLPSDFAERVIELESLLDENYSLELIQDLNELYRVAIDYFIQFEPRKAQHFQRKMTKLLADPTTLSLIQSKEPQKLTLERSPRMATKSKIKEEMNKFDSCSKQYIKNIIEKSEKALQNKERIKKIDLNRQEESLNNRIMLKKSRSQEKLLRAIS